MNIRLPGFGRPPSLRPLLRWLWRHQYQDPSQELAELLAYRHRTLVAGLLIHSQSGTKDDLSYIGSGTLTGLATRNSDGHKMLVTNRHVMAGSDDEGNGRNPKGDEMMFQGTYSWNDKVGGNLVWEPLSFTKPNLVDIAMCELDDGVGAKFTLHDRPHTDRTVIAGTKAPEKGLVVTILGGTTGEKKGTITATNRTLDIGGMTFTGVMQIRCAGSGPISEPGDSGAPVLYEVQEGVYRMVGIMISSKEVVFTNIGSAFPASTAERVMGITFGSRESIANGGLDR